MSILDFPGFRPVAALLAVISFGQAQDAPLFVDLGSTNHSGGLRVPSGGDGTNAPDTVSGSPCCRLDGTTGHYLYVCIENPAWKAPAPRDLYATFEIFDEGFTFLRLQYDKDDPTPSIASKYSFSPDTALLTGSGQWKRVHFALPSARLGSGQNWGADFRLQSSSVAVRRIEVSGQKPEGYEHRHAGLDPETLAGIRVERPPGMELTIGNDADTVQAALYYALSVTSVESYVDWAGVEPKPGEWDWSKWDEQVRILREAKLKWVPFLIAGPAYATPLWFQESRESACYRCLEHGEWSKVQSLFNPALRPQIDRFLGAFAQRYRDAGVIESVLLGVTGIYGESLYPAGHADGGWTGKLTGPYHNHLGWWAGDPLAIASFRQAMRQQYSGISALNQAWGTRYTSFEEVAPFLPDKAPSEQARSDLAEWYQRAMTEWSAFWVQTARKHFPNTELYLCTGGAGDPVLGADFTAQAKAIAPYHAGIRITNEGSDFANNFIHVREALSATSHYGTFAGFEPASSVNARGEVARIYGASSAGARQLHDYAPNLLNPEAMPSFRANIAHLAPRRPKIDAALYASRETWALDAPARARWHEHARRLRDVTDYHIVTRLSVADGALQGVRALVLTECAALEPAAAKALESWVSSGGILLAATRTGETLASRLFDNTAWRDRLFAKMDAVPAPSLEPHLLGPAPSTWALHLGADEDRDWLFGDWHSPENASEWKDGPAPKRRWTGALAGVYLPVRPRVPYTLRLDAYLSGHSLQGASPQENLVRVNGQTVGSLQQTRPGIETFTVPAAVIGENNVVRLEFSVKTWKPSEHGSTDTRELGLMVHRIEWKAQDAPPSTDASHGLPAIEIRPAPEAIRALTRRVGSGSTLILPGFADDPLRLARALAALFAHSGDYFPGVPPWIVPDGRLDGRYATSFDHGVLWFDSQNAGIEPEIRGPKSK